MPTQKLSDKSIKNAKAPDGGRLMLWDSVVADDASLPGSFGIRVTSTGVKSWIIMYRVEDATAPRGVKQQYRKIGAYPALSLGKARDVARDALKLVGQGIDPIKAKEAEKQKVASIKTVREAVEVFMTRHVKKNNRSWHEIERVFNTYVVPKLGDKPLPSVGPGDIHDLLDGLVDAGHPYMANRLFAHTRKFFNWCAERSWVEDPPTKNIKKPAEEEARDRVLDDAEIKLFWESSGELGWPFGPLLKVLLLTGQRRNEVAGMRWVDLDFKKKVWTMPKGATKSKRQHDVPLSDGVVALLEALPKVTVLDEKTGNDVKSPYVFSTNGKKPVSGFSKSKKRLDDVISTTILKEQGSSKWTDEELDEVRLTAWRIHDIRRTAASGMAKIGIAPHVIEKVLNHSTGQISGVAAVYNRHEYLKEKTDALNAWARALDAIVQSDSRGENIINLPERGQ